MSFKVGDTVVLNSGGPIMTIFDIGYKYCYTSWFNDGEFCYHKFDKRVLKLHEVDL